MPFEISRRNFLAGCAGTTAALHPLVLSGSSMEATQQTILLCDGWIFSGKTSQSILQSQKVSLPHCVTKLSWQQWDAKSWEDVWLYRRSFARPKIVAGERVFLHFEQVMVGCTPTLNGTALPQHLGGFDAFEYEVTHLLRDGDNELLVEVDARQLNVPPTGLPGSKPVIDYMLPGGIVGEVSLRVLPAVFMRDLFAKPVDVLSAQRRLEISCSLDAAGSAPNDLHVQAVLRDEQGRVVARASQAVDAKSGDVRMVMEKLAAVQLWHVDAPHLYDLTVTLTAQGRPLQTMRTRVGFRETRFEVDGFFLNGERLQFMGLNRHALFPYVGFAAAPRMHRKDAEIIKKQLNCNMVRCSHYPQSEEFLDACDRLGLMVWEEIPGWQYIGDDAWKQLAVRDMRAMVLRDRNHPSIVIWGSRVNESPNEEGLYAETCRVAKTLDGTRPTSGSMTPSSMKTWKEKWHEDVLAFDDYHAEKPGVVGIHPPSAGVPYMLAEMVGQFNYGRGRGFDAFYRRSGDVSFQMQQPLRHAEAFNLVAAQPRIGGAIAWCAFDYGSTVNAWHNVKTPGVCDGFRIPKLGAAFYLSQCSPKVRAVIEPGFYWDFGAQTPDGPGKDAAIFSNCERLEIFIGGKHVGSLHPDRERFAHLKYPPFFADLSTDDAKKPELRIDGYVGGRLALTRQFSSDASQDKLTLVADDASIRADGVDATRVVFAVADRYGNPRAFAEGEVSFTVEGDAELVGDNPFSLKDSGGAGAVWVRSRRGRTGPVIVRARCVPVGNSSATIRVV